MTRQEAAIRSAGLTLLRCDLGSGGWSLHCDDEAETLVASGDAEMTRDGWSRPDAFDVAKGVRWSKVIASKRGGQ